jgi:DDE superfamily endonuclease
MTGVIFQQYLIQFNNYVGRKVLLIIDNAPSHVWENLHLSNLEIIALPPNTTSKLQPLDAGIIAAFKRHYRKHQLNLALDQLDDGRNPFKVDQLIAMKWVNRAWNSLLPSTFQNCWRHTGLINNNTSSEEISNEPEITVAEYEYAIEQFKIHDAMPLEDFLNPIEEENAFTHEMLTDDEILEIVQHIEEDEEQEMAEEIPNPVANLSLTEQTRILGRAVAVLELHCDSNRKIDEAIEVLRRVQGEIRWNIAKEDEKRWVQKSLFEYF